MANNVESNFREKVMPTFLEKFERSRVFSKTVNTQLLNGVFDANSGDSVAFKRPTEYVAIETPDGDLTSEVAGPIIVGNAFGRVQNYITVWVEYQQIEQALKLNTLDQLLEPAAKRLATQLELNFAKFMMKNTALLSGSVGTPVSTWDHIADFGAEMCANGIPEDGWTTAINPYTQKRLASDTRSLGAGGSAGTMITESHKKAIITEDFAGLTVLRATTQGKYTAGAGVDRVGSLSANPDVTYVAAKDTFTQSLTVADFEANLEIKAGEQIQIAGRNRLNLSTRELILDDLGQPIPWTATVTADVTLSGTGTGTIVVTGPAVFEVDGAFNTVDSAPISGDVVTILGAAGATQQPNLFWHPNAFSIGSVDLPKLDAQVNTGTTSDGIKIKVTRGSDFIKNKNMVRFDILPAFAVLNPFFAGQGFGTP